MYLHYQLPIKAFKKYIRLKGSIEGHKSTLFKTLIVQYVVQMTMNEAPTPQTGTDEFHFFLLACSIWSLVLQYKKSLFLCPGQ